MSNIRKIINEGSLMLPCLYLVAVITLGIISVSVFRGLGFSDEPWYLILLRDQKVSPGTWWPLFFKWLPDHVLTIRLVTGMLLALSSGILGYGFYAFFKEKYKLRLRTVLPLSSVAFLGTFCFSNAVCLVPCYYHFNHMILQTAVGLTLLGFSGSALWFLLSGLIIGFLPFAMITNTPVIAVFFIVIIACFGVKRRESYLFLLGLFAANLLFFTFIQSPDQFLEALRQGAKSTQSSAGHGLKPMIRWSVDTVRYCVAHFLIPAFLLYFLHQRITTAKKTDMLSIIAALLLIIHLVFPFFTGVVLGAPLGILPIDIVSVFAVWAILLHHENFRWRDWTVVVLLFLVPFFAALGTNVDFSIRSVHYIGAIWGACAFCILLATHDKGLRMAGMVVLFLMAVGFTSNFFHGNWSTVHSLYKNRCKIPGERHGLRVNREVVDEVVAIEKITGKHQHVVLRDDRFWRVAYLLEMKPVTYNFRGEDSRLMEKISQVAGNRLILLESKSALFSQAFWNAFKEQSGWSLASSHEVTSGKIVHIATKE